MDHDEVVIQLRLGPVDEGVEWTWTPRMPRWRAEDCCRDFGAGVPWEGRQVLGALISPVSDATLS